MKFVTATRDTEVRNGRWEHVLAVSATSNSPKTTLSPPKLQYQSSSDKLCALLPFQTSRNIYFCSDDAQFMCHTAAEGFTEILALCGVHWLLYIKGLLRIVLIPMCGK